MEFSFLDLKNLQKIYDPSDLKWKYSGLEYQGDIHYSKEKVIETIDAFHDFIFGATFIEIFSSVIKSWMTQNFNEHEKIFDKISRLAGNLHLSLLNYLYKNNQSSSGKTNISELKSINHKLRQQRVRFLNALRYNTNVDFLLTLEIINWLFYFEEYCFGAIELIKSEKYASNREKYLDHAIVNEVELATQYDLSFLPKLVHGQSPETIAQILFKEVLSQKSLKSIKRMLLVHKEFKYLINDYENLSSTFGLDHYKIAIEFVMDLFEIQINSQPFIKYETWKEKFKLQILFVCFLLNPQTAGNASSSKKYIQFNAEPKIQYHFVKSLVMNTKFFQNYETMSLNKLSSCNIFGIERSKNIKPISIASLKKINIAESDCTLPNSLQLLLNRYAKL